MPIPPLSFRSVFVSDVHLGSAGCRAEEFEQFLRSFDCENLYLVGDIIDLWVAVKKGKWRQEHTNVIRTLLGKSKRGCIVRYTPGNHDAFLRKVNGAELGNIQFENSFQHTLADGRSFYVTHGDLFDKTVKSQLLALAGAWLYELTTGFANWMNKMRVKVGREPKPIGQLKAKLKKAINKMTSYEEKLAEHAWASHHAGVICGHIHRPALIQRADGIVYANCGDWVEHATCLVEHFNGKLELLTWDQLQSRIAEAPNIDWEISGTIPGLG